MKKLVCMVALATVMIGSPAAASTLFSFDSNNSYVNVVSNNTSCIFGTCALNAGVVTPLSNFSLNVGQSHTFNFAHFTFGGGFGTGSAVLSAQLAFLTPGLSSAGTGANANYLRLDGIFTPGLVAGSLNWATPSQQVITSNGTRYTVTFGNLSGVYNGARFTGAVPSEIMTGGHHGGTLELWAPVTVTLDSAVPEPSTWAMMIFGFGMIGFVMRRRPVRAAIPALA